MSNFNRKIQRRDKRSSHFGMRDIHFATKWHAQKLERQLQRKTEPWVPRWHKGRQLEEIDTDFVNPRAVAQLFKGKTT